MAWRRLGWLPFVAGWVLLGAGDARAERSVETQYATIRFTEESHLNEFLWRITGNRLSPGFTAAEPVKSRVDELVDRVQAILDVYPASLHFNIDLTAETRPGAPPARYEHDRKTVTVSPGTATDGMLAHEIAHAVICAHFTPPPPEKAQEILARYVDENLWSEA